MNQAYTTLELNKILLQCAEYAVLEKTKLLLPLVLPSSDLKEVKDRLSGTDECTRLLFRFGTGKVEYYPPIGDELQRAKKGSTLSCGELLTVAALLRSARIAYKSVHSVAEDLPFVKRLTLNLAFDAKLEDDIKTKIVSENEVSDFASDKLYSIRREIRLLNEKIRSKLGEYLTGDTAKYLQESIVTMRDDRYVLPVRTEYKRSVKGFIHDRSQSGQTVFIEPEYVLELNNELRSLTIDEKEEVERILKELSNRVGAIADGLVRDEETLAELDGYYARAEYGYKMKATCPKVNDRGYIRIQKGRHPLIDQTKVIPVSLALGEEYDFLLISGPNTGGKTVTMKMTGLFCLMAACGFFIPAQEGSEVSVFGSVYADIGDSQSIEESLSTFSSHVKNIIDVTENADENSLVLIDELGGGTDPEEGQALARAVTEYLLKKGCKGIITTHYTTLKEYAYTVGGIENASMEFDGKTLQPLYNIKIGMPGNSNALSICRRLGLSEEILEGALTSLSIGAKSFENILRRAEDTRIEAETTLKEAKDMRQEWGEKLSAVETELEKLKKDRENLTMKARTEARRIINERTAEAEELLDAIEEIFQKEELSQADLIRARTLKNKLRDSAFMSDSDDENKPEYEPVDGKTLKVGDRVFVGVMSSEGRVVSVRADKKEAEVEVNGIRTRMKFSELKKPARTPSALPPQKKKPAAVSGSRNLKPRLSPLAEINVLGLTVMEAVAEIDPFIDQAVISNLTEIKIVHGFGTGKLRLGVHEYLRTHPNVASYRLGRYGEGEGGVTIVTLK